MVENTPKVTNHSSRGRIMYRCNRCGGMYSSRGDLVQLSPLSALGCPRCAGECSYIPLESINSDNTRVGTAFDKSLDTEHYKKK